MYEIFEQLLEKYGVTTYQVAKATGISTSSFTGWKQGKWGFKQDKLKKIADFFGVSIEYLMTGSENSEEKKTDLVPISERDIAKRFDDIIGDMSDPDGSPLYFNGVELDDKTKEIMATFVTNVRQQFELMQEMAKKK